MSEATLLISGIAPNGVRVAVYKRPWKAGEYAIYLDGELQEHERLDHLSSGTMYIALKDGRRIDAMRSSLPYVDLLDGQPLRPLAHEHDFRFASDPPPAADALVKSVCIVPGCKEQRLTVLPARAPAPQEREDDRELWRAQVQEAQCDLDSAGVPLARPEEPGVGMTVPERVRVLIGERDATARRLGRLMEAINEATQIVRRPSA